MSFRGDHSSPPIGSGRKRTPTHQFAQAHSSRTGSERPTLKSAIFMYTRGPDWYPATVEDATPDAPIDVTFLTGSFMVRVSTTAYWTTLGGFTIAAYPSTYPPEPCTHTGPQQ